jgi:hypothetical protein
MKRLLLVLALATLGPGASAAPLAKAEQTCAIQLQDRGAAVASAQGRDSLRCLKQAAKGRELDPQGCVAADARGKVGRALAKLAAVEAARCVPPPPFGIADAATLGDAAVAETRGLLADFLGADLGAALVAKAADRAAAACQAVVAKRAEKLRGALLAVAGKAHTDALRGKRMPAAEGADALAAAVVTALMDDAQGKIGRASGKLSRDAVRKCTGDLASLFPGCALGDAAATAACVDVHARCRSCQALALGGGYFADCDAFDDGTANASCLQIGTPPVPTLLESSPAAGAVGTLPHAWLRLAFDAPFPAGRLAEIEVTCDGADQTVRTEQDVIARVVVSVIPDPPLPAGASCELHWPEDQGGVSFSTGAAVPFVLYDRSDVFQIGPVPDDFLLDSDGATASGLRIAFPPPAFEGLLGLVADGIAVALSQFDGWSPLHPIVLGFSEALDPASVPLDEVASLVPGAAVGLFDVDPASPGFGERVPFTGIVRSDPAAGGGSDHSLILFPALNLLEDGRYALVVTRDAAALGGGDFAPSGLFGEVASPAMPVSTTVDRARARLAPLLDVLEQDLVPPIPREDAALVLSIRTRTEFFDPADWVATKEQALAAPPSLLDVTDTQVLADEVVHRGTLTVPVFLNESLTDVTRDAGTGAPTALVTEDVPFVFRIPTGLGGPLPVVIYQHGSPGSPEEITGGGNGQVTDAGYAMLGLQDLGNRRFGEDAAAQTTEIIGRLAFVKALPLLNLQTHSDMFRLLRAIEGMGTPGNFPEVDPTRILFRGISFGAHHSLGFLPLAPEIVAAVSHVGSGRLYNTNLHQLDYQGLLTNILAALPGSRPADVIAGLALVQNAQDRDDPMLLARNLYRAPLAVEGQTDTTPPSLLWIEGIGDSLVPNTATRAAAVELGIPTVRPVPGPSPVLTEVDAPIQENLAAGVTAGHFQYDPALTPGCNAQPEGHFCAQGASEVVDQLLHFFATALLGSAEIIDPF